MIQIRLGLNFMGYLIPFNDFHSKAGKETQINTTIIFLFRI